MFDFDNARSELEHKLVVLWKAATFSEAFINSFMQAVINKIYTRSELKDISWVDAHYFLSSIAIAEADNKKPAHWKVALGGDFTSSDKRVCVKWSTLIKQMVKYGILPENTDVNRIAEYIGNNWPDSSAYNFTITNKVYDTYELCDFGSCMYGKPYTRWYDDNQEAVSIVKIEYKGSYVGRALLWSAKDEDGEPIKYLDRVYPSDGGAHTREVRAWAAAQGYQYKECDDMSDEDNLYTVVLNESSHNYPYMDTFKYAKRTDDGRVRLSTRYSHNSYKLDNTDGVGLDDEDNYCTCESCDDRLYDDDVISVYTSQYHWQSWCLSCATTEAIVISDRRSVSYDQRVADYLVVHLGDGATAADWDDLASCEVRDEYYFIDDLVSTKGGNLIHSEEAVCLRNGDYIAKEEIEELDIVEKDGEYHYLSDLLDDAGLSDDEEIKEWFFTHIGKGISFEKLIHIYTEVYGKNQITEVA